jgi:hypothetical protein
MSAVLAREIFSTSRLAEFCSRQQLVTATGRSVEYWSLYVLKEPELRIRVEGIPKEPRL